MRLSVDRRTLARWHREGKLAAVVTPGGHRRYREDDIDALLVQEPVAAPALEEAPIPRAVLIKFLRTRGWNTKRVEYLLDQIDKEITR